MHLLLHALTTAIHSIMELTDLWLDAFKWFKMLQPGCWLVVIIYSPILTSLHWLPVKQRIELNILVFVFKALHGLAPIYLSDLLHCHNPPRALRSGNLGVLSVRRSRLKHRGDRAFAKAGLKLWNSLLVSIWMVSSLSSFKYKLKAHLLMYYSNCMYAVL